MPAASRAQVRWPGVFPCGAGAWEAFARPGIGERVEAEVMEAG